MCLFVGKHWKDYPTAGATAVAATLRKIPVCTQLDRNADMLSLGGRPPSSATYSATFAPASGVVSSLKLTATTDAGGTGGRGVGTT
eukprot:SAG11_NODE_13839_length_637_cov_0.897770_1_plen_85_part_10